MKRSSARHAPTPFCGRTPFGVGNVTKSLQSHHYRIFLKENATYLPALAGVHEKASLSLQTARLPLE